tara:strand:- start:69 stop:779 length:711 start_codon:yes stop_codon:yes gene_type:complete
MSLLLRVDVDKPYGRHTLFRKIVSKLNEDYITYLPKFIGYLSHLKIFLSFCNDRGVRCHLYHRICTVPDSETMQIIKREGHLIGLHLEDSRNIDCFKKELSLFTSLTGISNVKSFTKHGSGFYKLGKNHYPPYEPDKYKVWAKEIGIEFIFGNGIPSKVEDIIQVDGFYNNMFWMEPDYRSSTFNSIDKLIEIASDNDVVVLIHPSNFVADINTRNDFIKLIELANLNNIKWKLIS